jgi:hypothetical protein
MTTSRLTLAALAAFSSICTLAGASAQAQTDSPRSRAEVIAEVHAARAAGTLGAYSGEDSGSFHLSRQAGTSRPRAEVVAELTAFRESGAMAAQVPEDQFFASQGSPSTLTRAEVVAELTAARAAGELGVLHGEDSGSFHIAQRGHAPAATWMAGATAPTGSIATAQLSQMCASPELGRGGSEMRLASSTR